MSSFLFSLTLSENPVPLPDTVTTVRFVYSAQNFHVGAGSSRTSASSPDLIPLVSTHAHHSFHRHSGLGQGAIFYLFLQATSKANLQTLLTMGPILVDSTPPRVTATLTAEVDGDHLAVSWEKGVVVDLEQPRDIEFEYTFRVGESRSCRITIECWYDHVFL